MPYADGVVGATWRGNSNFLDLINQLAHVVVGFGAARLTESRKQATFRLGSRGRFQSRQMMLRNTSDRESSD